MIRKKILDQSIKATRIDVFDKEGILHHRMICPYCRKNLVFRKESQYYPKGPTMKCPECKRIFKKFERPLKRE